MSDYSVTIYNPNNAYDTLYVRQNQNVVAYDTIPQQTSRTNYGAKVFLETPPDTFELSAESKIKKNKEKSMPTGMQWLLGTVGVVAAGFATHKFVPPMLVKSRVEKIFLENFTKDEAKAIQKKYQDILKISDKDEFLDKLFAELKKDYKLDNVPIKLDKTFAKGTESGAIRGAAHFSPDHSKPYLDLGIDKTYDNQTLLKHITHELRHAKQDLACYQVGTREDLISVYKDRLKDTFSKENWSQEKIDENATELVDEVIKFYDKIGIKKMDSTSRNYDWGKKILNSYRTYANKSDEAYRTTLYETEAKTTEILMDRMVNNHLF